MLPVQKLPHADAGGAQAKTSTAIGVEENCPVVKLLPEHDARVGYGFITVFLHDSTSSPQVMPIEDTELFAAICVPRYGGVLYHSKNICYYGLLYTRFSGNHEGAMQVL